MTHNWYESNEDSKTGRSLQLVNFGHNMAGMIFLLQYEILNTQVDLSHLTYQANSGSLCVLVYYSSPKGARANGHGLELSCSSKLDQCQNKRACVSSSKVD